MSQYERKLDNGYFEWLYHIVFNEGYSRLSYRKLLMFLYQTEFIYFVEFDENRAQDGIDFRYKFAYEHGYSSSTVDRNRPCSVLEMMVALACKGEEQVMDDSDYGDRTGQWFWNMIVSLGLGSMSDKNFDEYYVAKVIERFLYRQYEPNGSGGLFTIDNCECDLREIELWKQFMWYLNNIIEQRD